ncbi:hypothetical protein [Algoriphagus antarcticus]|uniref:Uncharacterized protein n=1 Tax=Algoriphagus antarcticus TaxID=238540 RepID=A0A3E0E3B0_9BACT|nr:hypothetical protein [Algoriphagus antarcticus]REG91436.1 hypothetical protein C8N25_10450 [Algoriphagus antarcticus]
MKFFYLSSIPNDNGQHEVHDRECEFIPDPYDRDYIGPYNTCIEALRKATTMKKEVGLCKNCCSSTAHAIISNLNDRKG